MFAGIPVAFLSTALPVNLYLVCSQVLGSLSCGVRFARVAHRFQAEINMNSLFEQGDVVADHIGNTGLRILASSLSIYCMGVR